MAFWAHHGIRFAEWRRLLPLLLAAACFAPAGLAQEPALSDTRPVKKYVKPTVPEFARRMQLRGMVRLQATVLPSGKVAEVKALGGNPVLVQAGKSALESWIFETGNQTTTTVVTLSFN
jgi:outer membrane biosynthesis protein TonB